MDESYPAFKYNSTTYKNARIGTIITMHGYIHTPAFIFCATRGTIKGLETHQMKSTGTQIILANTYHLMLKPGGTQIEALGGLQRFTGWDGPMLTDSGGFQAFSLNSRDKEKIQELKRKYSTSSNKTGITRISEDGIECKSYYDGSMFFLSPEESMEVQIRLGADLVVVLDECTKFSEDREYNYQALLRNERWAERSLVYFQENKKKWQGLYGIVHGGIFPELRQRSAEFNNSREFFGNAIGGSLGRNKKEMEDVVGMSMTHLHRDKPVHLLGIGGISDIFMGVDMGIDTFDCVHPTRIARHGGALVKRSSYPNITREHINLNNQQFKTSDEAIEKNCNCHICRSYSKGYLHYLLSVRENIVFSLITHHNVYFMNEMMSRIRKTLLYNPQDISSLKVEYCGSP